MYPILDGTPKDNDLSPSDIVYRLVTYSPTCPCPQFLFTFPWLTFTTQPCDISPSGLYSSSYFKSSLKCQLSLRLFSVCFPNLFYTQFFLSQWCVVWRWSYRLPITFPGSRQSLRPTCQFSGMWIKSLPLDNVGWFQLKVIFENFDHLLIAFVCWSIWGLWIFNEPIGFAP